MSIRKLSSCPVFASVARKHRPALKLPPSRDLNSAVWLGNIKDPALGIPVDDQGQTLNMYDSMGINS